MESKGTLNSQNNLENEQSCGVSLPDFKPYYKTMVIKTGWHLHKDKLLGQWNRIPGNRPSYVSGQRIFENSTKIIQWG